MLLECGRNERKLLLATVIEKSAFQLWQLDCHSLAIVMHTCSPSTPEGDWDQASLGCRTTLNPLTTAFPPNTAILNQPFSFTASVVFSLRRYMSWPQESRMLSSEQVPLTDELPCLLSWCYGKTQSEGPLASFLHHGLALWANKFLTFVNWPVSIIL